MIPKLVSAGVNRQRRDTLRLQDKAEKVAPQVIQSTRVPGTAGNASEMIVRKARANMELRQHIRELIQPGRPTSVSASARATSRQASPRQNVSPDEAQVASVAAVIRAVSTTEDEVVAGKKWGPPGELGQTFC